MRGFFGMSGMVLTHIAGIMELSTSNRVDVFLRRNLWVPHKFFSS